MSERRPSAANKRVVVERARGCCEYCCSQERFATQSFAIEHIDPESAGGETCLENLALSCQGCNSFKGSNIAGLDPKTGKLSPLFNPRRHKWSKHFRWKGPVLVGRTAIGRTTVAVLNINEPLRVELREELIEEGEFPPS
jgi:hypothetical protein